jgi:hypothetical protein
LWHKVSRIEIIKTIELIIVLWRKYNCSFAAYEQNQTVREDSAHTIRRFAVLGACMFPT